jgi:UDP-N-acetylmuramate dehydrogenase
MYPKILNNQSLKPFNTFGVEVTANFFTEFQDERHLSFIFNQEEIKGIDVLVLGGGSNILFTKDFGGLVLLNRIGGIEVRREGDDCFVTAGGGVVWNDLVSFCVQKDIGGIENMTLIPGTVGAAPVQNIGAYGTELMDVFESCRAYDRRTGEMRTFTKEECHFSYRDSLFKKEGKDRYIITGVTLKLSARPELNLSYGSIQEELRRREILNPTIRDVSAVVADIRVNKLPDPSTIGNSGSFFKNPIISRAQFDDLQSCFSDIVYYPIQSGEVKLAAGWLIENCGWKGKRVGNTGTWKNQALVLVNYGNASGVEIYNLSERIIESVFDKFGVRLEREVNIF